MSFFDDIDRQILRDGSPSERGVIVLVSLVRAPLLVVCWVVGTLYSVARRLCEIAIELADAGLGSE